MGNLANNQVKKPKVPRGTLKTIAKDMKLPYNTIQSRWKRGEPIVVNKVLLILKPINEVRIQNHELKKEMGYNF